MENYIIAVLVLILLALVIGLIYLINLINSLKTRKNIEEEDIKRLNEENTIRSKEIILEAEKKALQLQSETEKTLFSMRNELNQLEKNLITRQDLIDRRESSLELKYQDLEKQKSSLEQSKKDTSRIRQELSQKLDEISQLTKEEARNIVITKMTEDLKDEYARKIKEFENDFVLKSDEITKNILVESMERSAVDYVSETTITVFNIPNEDVKGKIIGKEGRNIKVFERLTGVDVLIDETPDSICLSCFDPVRRHVASLAMEKLVADGRIHPGRIEEVVLAVKKDVAKEIRKNGENLAFDAGFTNLDPGLIKLLGRFKYRTSYGQALDKHTMEVVNICGQIAGELGVNVKLAKKCALFHDVGKVLTHEIEGGHPELGVMIAEKFHLEEAVKNAMLAHHHLAEPICIESALVYIGDAISGARPGARFNSVDDYSKRVKALEDVAREYDGVKEVYAIHAGREVRVLVVPEKLQDKDITILAHDIAKKIHDTQTYAGTVKINVIRETRAEDIAK